MGLYFRSHSLHSVLVKRPHLNGLISQSGLIFVIAYVSSSSCAFVILILSPYSEMLSANSIRMLKHVFQIRSDAHQLSTLILTWFALMYGTNQLLCTKLASFQVH